MTMDEGTITAVDMTMGAGMIVITAGIGEQRR
jgi:hypothetical protein